MDADLIVFTEKRAGDLRVRYSNYLAPRRLLARVLDIEQRALARLSADEKTKPASCFGQAFGGYTDPTCAVCQLQAACLTRTTAHVLPDAEAAVGLTPRALCEEMGVPLSALSLMQGLREALREPAGPETTPEPLLQRGTGRRPSPDVRALRNTPRGRPVRASTAACLLGAQASETAWPPLVDPTAFRLGHGVKDTYRIQILSRPLPKLTYGSPVWQRRVARDRRRIPELDWLPDGTKFLRLLRGELVEVLIYPDRLMWRGRPYATLYEVSAAAAGRCEYKMPPSVKHGGTRMLAKINAVTFFKYCLAQVRLRARLLRHAQDAHPAEVVPMLGGWASVCPVCEHDVLS